MKSWAPNGGYDSFQWMKPMPLSNPWCAIVIVQCGAFSDRYAMLVFRPDNISGLCWMYDSRACSLKPLATFFWTNNVWINLAKLADCWSGVARRPGTQVRPLFGLPPGWANTPETLRRRRELASKLLKLGTSMMEEEAIANMWECDEPQSCQWVVW